MAAMGLVLGSSLVGVAYLAIHLHVLPIADQSKSVLAQVSQAVYGSSTAGKVFYLILQIATTLILVLAANTSFADFPRLASFHAGDAFLPRQFTKRGHRLVYSTGIIALAVAASVLLIGFKASVSGLIPLRAGGVHLLHVVAGGDEQTAPPPEGARDGGSGSRSTSPAPSPRGSSWSSSPS